MCGHSLRHDRLPAAPAGARGLRPGGQAEGREPGRPDHRRGEDRPDGGALVPLHGGVHADGTRISPSSRSTRASSAPIPSAAMSSPTGMLHARGREETMILGSETLKPMVRALLPKAEITTRPRFSTLSYVGPAKLSRLPPRSAIVAFSAEQVYAVAEMLRRMRGGAAVVMGALSPAHPQRPGRHVSGRRGRLSRRHRRDRHGPQHGRRPCRLRRPLQVRRQAPPAPDRPPKWRRSPAAPAATSATARSAR